MAKQILRDLVCPNCGLSYSGAREKERNFHRHGTYKVKHSRQPVARFKCKGCDAVFSYLSPQDRSGHKRPDLNKRILKLLASGVTIRRSAQILGCDRKTVETKMTYLARQARKSHQEFLDSGYYTDLIHFDEMESYLATKLKPVSIPLAVDGRTGLILSVGACVMPARGRTTERAVQLYGWISDQRPRACMAILLMSRKIAGSRVLIVTDGKAAYAKYVASAFAGLEYKHVSSPRKKTETESSKKARIGKAKATKVDPIFHVNHMAAKMRADMARLRRKTWASSKNIERLRDHLWLYVAWNNKYEITWE